MEAWELGTIFCAGRKTINRAVVWLRLPTLPLEFWVPSVILAIVAEAGKPLAMDDSIDLLQKTGYA